MKLQPSQLYINEEKLQVIQNLIDTGGVSAIDPIPIKQLDEELIFTDGHTRAFVLYKLGHKEALVEWETENLSWLEYRECVKWCKREQIRRIGDLESRIISSEEYKIKWLKRCKDNRKALGISD